MQVAAFLPTASTGTPLASAATGASANPLSASSSSAQAAAGDDLGQEFASLLDAQDQPTGQLVSDEGEASNDPDSEAKTEDPLSLFGDDTGVTVTTPLAIQAVPPPLPVLEPTPQIISCELGDGGEAPAPETAAPPIVSCPVGGELQTSAPAPSTPVAVPLPTTVTSVGALGIPRGRPQPTLMQPGSNSTSAPPRMPTPSAPPATPAPTNSPAVPPGATMSSANSNAGQVTLPATSSAAVTNLPAQAAPAANSTNPSPQVPRGHPVPDTNHAPTLPETASEQAVLATSADPKKPTVVTPIRVLTPELQAMADEAAATGTSSATPVNPFAPQPEVGDEVADVKSGVKISAPSTPIRVLTPQLEALANGRSLAVGEDFGPTVPANEGMQVTVRVQTEPEPVDAPTPRLPPPTVRPPEVPTVEVSTEQTSAEIRLATDPVAIDPTFSPDKESEPEELAELPPPLSAIAQAELPLRRRAIRTDSLPQVAPTGAPSASDVRQLTAWSSDRSVFESSSNLAASLTTARENPVSELTTAAGLIAAAPTLAQLAVDAATVVPRGRPTGRSTETEPTVPAAAPESVPLAVDDFPVQTITLELPTVAVEAESEATPVPVETSVSGATPKSNSTGSEAAQNLGQALKENTAGGRGKKGMAAALKPTIEDGQKFLNVDKEEEKESRVSVGMRVAESRPTMAIPTLPPAVIESVPETSSIVSAAVARPTAERPGHTSNTASETSSVRSYTAAVVREVMAAAEKLTPPRTTVELRLQAFDQENIRVQLVWRDGVIHARFVTESSELQQALNKEWDGAAPRFAEKGLKFGEASFEQRESNGHNAGSNAFSSEQHGRGRRPQIEREFPEFALPSFFSSVTGRAATVPVDLPSMATAMQPLLSAPRGLRAWA